MQSKARKWGNSLAVRIPKEFAAKAGMEDGSPVEIKVSGQRIILSPSRRKKKYSLNALLAGINRDNLHGEVDVGKGKGREIW